MPRSSIQESPTAVSDLRQRRTRKALREGLLRLMKAKSLEEITARDIAAESLVGYNTFFRHYPSKTELIEEIVTDEVSQVLEITLPLLVQAKIQAATLALCEYVFQKRALWSALLNGGAGDSLRQIFIRRALERNIRRSEHEWLPMELGAIFGVGAALDILRWWLTKPEEFTQQKIAEFLERLVVVPTLGAIEKPAQLEKLPASRQAQLNQVSVQKNGPRTSPKKIKAS